MLIPLFFSLAALAAASPQKRGLHYRTAAIEARQTGGASTCSQIKSHCSRIGQQARATSWCASYEGTPIVTKTVTPTSTSLIAPSCGGSPTTSNVQPTSDADADKAAAMVAGEPGCLGSTSTASAACACLSLPSTVTVTTMGPATTITATGPFNIAYGASGTSSYAALGEVLGPNQSIFYFANGASAASRADDFLLGAGGLLIDATHNYSRWYKPINCTLDEDTCGIDCGIGKDDVSYNCNFQDWTFGTADYPESPYYSEDYCYGPLSLSITYSTTSAS